MFIAMASLPPLHGQHGQCTVHCTYPHPAPPLLKPNTHLPAPQELALPMSQLAEYIGDAAPTAGPYWMEGGALKGEEKGEDQPDSCD